jgi:hypothetical protein
MPMASCHAYVTQLQQRQKNIQILAYPGAPMASTSPGRGNASQPTRAWGPASSRSARRDTWHIGRRPTVATDQCRDGARRAAGADRQPYAAAVHGVTTFLPDRFKRP